MEKIDIWYAISLLGILIMLVWAILKVFGIINTPMWLELVPVFGGLIAVFGSINHYLIKMALFEFKLADLSKNMHEVLETLKTHGEKLVKIESKLDFQDNQFLKIERKLKI